MNIEGLIVAAALIIAIATQPWRLYLHSGARCALKNGQPPTTARTRQQIAPSAIDQIGPALVLLALLPFVWNLPLPAPIAGQLHWSGAALATLMLGWPMAVLVLVLASFLTCLTVPDQSLGTMLALACWQGVVPASLALGFGALLRRLFNEQIFVYVLGRAFFGTVLSVFLASALDILTGNGDADPVWVALWLMAWGEGIITGMLTSVMVAFAPQHLATWSDALYLRKPPA